jgi:hypothetical protein
MDIIISKNFFARGDKKTSSEPDAFMVVRAGFEPTTHGFHSTALPTLAGESLRIPELPYRVINVFKETLKKQISR